LESGDPTQYRLPLSLIGPRPDVDKCKYFNLTKVQKPCLVFDICMNTVPYQRTCTDEEYQHLVIEMILQYIEQKHTMSLSRGKK
jgi:hypothetical protein